MARCPDLQLSHEASIGMIIREKLSYQIETGLAEGAALALRGFLSLDEKQCPKRWAPRSAR